MTYHPSLQRVNGRDGNLVCKAIVSYTFTGRGGSRGDFDADGRP